MKVNIKVQATLAELEGILEKINEIKKQYNLEDCTVDIELFA